MDNTVSIHKITLTAIEKNDLDAKETQAKFLKMLADHKYTVTDNRVTAEYDYDAAGYGDGGKALIKGQRVTVSGVKNTA